MSLSFQRLAIISFTHFALLGGLVALAFASASQGDGGTAAFLTLVLLGYLLTLRRNPLAGWVAELILRRVLCPACGEVNLLNSTWGCPHCQYVSWLPRHAFSPCPNRLCRRTAAWIHCRNCDQSIAV